MDGLNIIKLVEMVEGYHRKGILLIDLSIDHIRYDGNQYIYTGLYSKSKEEIAKAIKEHLTVDYGHEVKGMAPEILLRIDHPFLEEEYFDSLDERCDIYSIGRILEYHLDEEYLQIIKQCTEYYPNKRYLSTNELMKAIKSINNNH